MNVNTVGTVFKRSVFIVRVSMKTDQQRRYSEVGSSRKYLLYLPLPTSLVQKYR